MYLWWKDFFGFLNSSNFWMVAILILISLCLYSSFQKLFLLNSVVIFLKILFVSVLFILITWLSNHHVPLFCGSLKILIVQNSFFFFSVLTLFYFLLWRLFTHAITISCALIVMFLSRNKLFFCETLLNWPLLGYIKRTANSLNAKIYHSLITVQQHR